MEVEAEPLLVDGNEKLDSPTHPPRLKQYSHTRSWAKAIATHTFIAILVLTLAISIPLPDFISPCRLRTTRAQPSLYCMFVAIASKKLFALTGNYPAPLGPAIKYTIDHPEWDAWSNSLYFGPPSDKSERAWNKLIHREFPFGVPYFGSVR